MGNEVYCWMMIKEQGKMTQRCVRAEKQAGVSTAVVRYWSQHACGHAGWL